MREKFIVVGEGWTTSDVVYDDSLYGCDRIQVICAQPSDRNHPGMYEAINFMMRFDVEEIKLDQGAVTITRTGFAN